MESELSIQEKSFKAYIDLETEELTNFCHEIASTQSGKEGTMQVLLLLKEYVHKRVEVLNEAHALFLAVEAARSKEAATEKTFVKRVGDGFVRQPDGSWSKS